MRLLCLFERETRRLSGFEVCDHEEMRKVVASFNADPKKFSEGALEQIETTFQDLIKNQQTAKKNNQSKRK